MMGELGFLLDPRAVLGDGPSPSRTDSTGRRDLSVWKGRLPELESSAGRPPYQVLAEDFLLCVVDLDTDALRPILPSGLAPSEAGTGIIGVYRALHGFGGEPFSACFLSVAVEGPGIAEDVPTFMKVAGWYSGSAGRLLNGIYDRRLGSGEVVHRREGPIWSAEGGPAGRPVISLQMRQIANDAPLSMGTHRVMGLSSQGALSSYTVSYSSRFIEAEPLQLEIDPSGSDLLSRLGPMRPSFCYYSPTSFLTFGVPELWPVGRRDDDREAAHSEMLGILGYLGRAAVVLGRDGRVRYANGYAKRLLGGSLAPGVPLHPSREADRKALRNLVQRALEGGTAVDRLSLDRTVDSAPFLVRAICLDSSALGGEGVLLLLGNAFEKGDINKAGLLQLFGLSPAEAKLALLVGMGQPPREAAQQVNVTENTARSVLKTVFHKLGISRQAELVGIVTRLDMM